MRALLALALTATPALAEDYRPIKDKAQFMALLADKELRNGLYNLTLKVTPDGAIKGNALGGASHRQLVLERWLFLPHHGLGRLRHTL